MANCIVTGNFVMVTGLTSRGDLNHRAARVLSKSWTEAARHPGRVPVEMVVGKEQIWVKLENIEGPIPDVAAMTAPPYDAMAPEERTEVGLFLLGKAPDDDDEHDKPLDPAYLRWCEERNITPVPETDNPGRAKMWRRLGNMFWEQERLIQARQQPAPATEPAFVHERHNIHRACGPLFMKEEPAPAPAPAPAADRRAAARAALQKMAAEHCPRPHYCIYCGSEGPVASKCAPCGFYRGTHCFGPNGPLQKGDTIMGRKLAFVKWPWQGDPDAPYVRAGAEPAPEPKSKYAVDMPPVRALTRDEVLGPTLGGCAGVCPKYPTCTAARLVAYVLGKVDHVTQGVAVDFRYCFQTNEDWRKMRERIIEIHEAGEENAAEVLHEEYLVQHHTLCETAPAYLPADWDGMKRRVKARQKKDEGAEASGELAYPDSDADEDEVAAYLEAMALRA